MPASLFPAKMADSLCFEDSVDGTHNMPLTTIQDRKNNPVFNELPIALQTTAKGFRIPYNAQLDAGHFLLVLVSGMA